jgi:hypothetical protein
VKEPVATEDHPNKAHERKGNPDRHHAPGDTPAFRKRTSHRPVFGNDARQVIAFGAGRYAFMSARSMVKLDTNAGKPSLTPLH